MGEMIGSNDEVLWLRASKGDEAAEEMLAEKYTWLVRACARPYFLAGGDSEDLIQEGMLGLLSAIRQFDPVRDAAFRTFAERCIRNRLFSAIKSAAGNKHTPLNDYVPLESPQFDETQTAGLGSPLNDPEELLITRERVNEIYNGISGALSGFESRVLKYYLEGLSYEEIANKIGKSKKSVDNAVQRLRKKLAQIIISGESQETERKYKPKGQNCQK